MVSAKVADGVPVSDPPGSKVMSTAMGRSQALRGQASTRALASARSKWVSRHDQVDPALGQALDLGLAKAATSSRMVKLAQRLDEVSGGAYRFRPRRNWRLRRPGGQLGPSRALTAPNVGSGGQLEAGAAEGVGRDHPGAPARMIVFMNGERTIIGIGSMSPHLGGSARGQPPGLQQGAHGPVEHDEWNCRPRALRKSATANPSLSSSKP